MPGTHDERFGLARAIAQGLLAPDALDGRRWLDGGLLTKEEQAQVFALAVYEIQVRKSREPEVQAKALRLLRRLLSKDQRRQLRAGRTFNVRGSAGGHFRLCPSTGAVWGLEQHGSRLYGVRFFCLHEPPGDPPLPPADRTVAHLLMLQTDEEQFVRTANRTEQPPSCWDGTWRRRLNEKRRAQRQEAS